MLRVCILCGVLLVFLSFSSSENEDPKNWWRTAVFYQIYPRSFLDTNGDGIGDLKGITSKLDYIKYLGVQATWLSPIYTSPMKDFGYDVQNYVDIDRLFGTMEDFFAYANKSKELGLKVIMDFVPNHSSDQHPWFINSVKRIDPYTHYYVWVDGKQGPNGSEPPNNWLSMFGGSSWEWNEHRKQYYYHEFLKEQPDLNMTNPLVRKELENAFRFWLDRGVDGFRIDAIRHLFEDEQLRDEPRSNDTSAKPDEYNYYDHIYTTQLPEIFDVIAEWRQLFDEYEAKDGFHRLMMVESAFDITRSLPYFGNDSVPLADIPFNLELIFKLPKIFNAVDVFKIVDGWLKEMPPTKWSNWIIGNHDNPRIASRTNPALVDAFNMICLLLRGTPITYYGEEIGMIDTPISWEEMQDPYGKLFGRDRYMIYNRDPERTPMQWNSEKFAGFTTGNHTWLPVNPDYKTLNVEDQKGTPRSHLNTYRKLVALKKEPAIINGTIHYPVITDQIFSFCRTIQWSPAIVVIVNFSNDTETVNLTLQNDENTDHHVPRIGTIEAMSDNVFPTLTDTSHMKVDLTSIILPPYQAVVVKFDPLWV